MAVDLSRPFRGSAAVAAGALTPNELRGPRFRRLFPDTYAPADLEPDLAVRSDAASVYVDGRGVLAGYSAAELLGASCAPQCAPAEVTVPGSERRSRPGLLVHRFRPAPDEITSVGGVELTTAPRTAYDLGRRPDRTEAVVAIDALARTRFPPAVLLDLAAEHRGDRGLARLRRAVQLADPRAESPMESRIRITIVRFGLPRPELQFQVGPYRLDLAYPQVRLAVEYDGRDHLTPERAIRDLRREASLTGAGWHVMRLRAGIVHRPRETALQIHRELILRGVEAPSVSPAW